MNSSIKFVNSHRDSGFYWERAAWVYYRSSFLTGCAMTMRRIGAGFLFLAMLAYCPRGMCIQSAGPNGQQQTPATQSSEVPNATENSQKVTAYTLPPDLYKKARERSRINFHLALIGFIYGLVVLLLLLRWQISPAYRTWAEKASGRRFLQALVFAPLVLLTIAVLTLPLDIYSQSVEKRFGISVQSWGSWSWDWVKAQIIALIIGTMFVWLLYVVIRRSPRRWWFYFWLIAMPIGILIFFLTPWVIDPLFHKFEPLQQKDPALTAALEQMEQRAGENIPPERMFWMGYRLIGWVLVRWGGAWGIRALDDWASLPVLMLLLSVFLFITNPIGSAFSRHLEHQADQYGLEVTHGLTPDSGQIAAQAFQILGEVNLADPKPNPVHIVLFYDHPPVSDRVRFSLD